MYSIVNTAPKEAGKKEQIKTRIYNKAEEASRFIAEEIATLIKQRQEEGRFIVLGLATGSTPIRVYEHLVRIHQEEGLSFHNLITFNLDEYYPMDMDSIHSYHRYMREHLFDHIDIPKDQIHIPDGTIVSAGIEDYCKNYEQRIIEAGGIDLQLLGIGRTGHIGFNEPGSGAESRTRLVRLDRITREDAASDFFGSEHVPQRAVTMGVGSIMNARRIILMAWGEGKAGIIKRAVEGDVNGSVPATFLQGHENCEFILDQAAASELTRVRTPWLIKECKWSEDLMIRAVLWLSASREKALLKLTNEDYNACGMGGLVSGEGSAEEINLKVFKDLQKRITGWPAGKPRFSGSPVSQSNPDQKRILIFSPHPDDDVISMGATLLRLVDQGHQVHVAYQTSGNIAVFDDEVLRFMDFAGSVYPQYKDFEDRVEDVRAFLRNKQPGEVDSAEIQEYKTLIREGEARAACRYCGIPEEHAHFLKLPFYQTGKVRKNPATATDVGIVKELLQEIRPHHIYAAGDLLDPHGTHRVCLGIIKNALRELSVEGTDWLASSCLWLYRGAWQEWDISEMDMIIPFGPKDLIRKRNAIFRHQSQKDKAMFPGHDDREFWQRAEQRNRDTAKKIDALGLAEYEAVEGFVRLPFSTL